VIIALWVVPVNTVKKERVSSWKGVYLEGCLLDAEVLVAADGFYAEYPASPEEARVAERAIDDRRSATVAIRQKAATTSQPNR
jgi:hypothetical protein